MVTDVQDEHRQSNFYKLLEKVLNITWFKFIVSNTPTLVYQVKSLRSSTTVIVSKRSFMVVRLSWSLNGPFVKSISEDNRETYSSRPFWTSIWELCVCTLSYQGLHPGLIQTRIRHGFGLLTRTEELRNSRLDYHGLPFLTVKTLSHRPSLSL